MKGKERKRKELNRWLYMPPERGNNKKVVFLEVNHLKLKHFKNILAYGNTPYLMNVTSFFFLPIVRRYSMIFEAYNKRHFFVGLTTGKGYILWDEKGVTLYLRLLPDESPTAVLPGEIHFQKNHHL